MPNDVIYVDFSTLNSFRDCHEQSRLQYVEHLVPLDERPALSFGTAFHAGVADFYKSLAVDKSRELALKKARMAFVKDLKNSNSALPISIESDEKRSVERGLNLLDAYFEKWRGETFENYVRPDTGEPYVEIGFSIYIMDWHGTPVMYVGRIDRIMRNRTDGNLYNMETKTTASGLNQFIKQVKPNHQISGYHLAARELLKLNVVGTVWDCIFVSDRKPKEDSKDPWLRKGIDMDKDFNRHETRRSATDLEEFMYDLEMTVTSYLQLKDSKLRRWERNAPSACHKYNGCAYREVCSMNLNPQVIRSNFKVQEWMPWKGIVEEAK